MRTTFLRWLDRNIGKFICFILTIHRKIFDFFLKPNFGKKISKILFVKLTEQGSSGLGYFAFKKAIFYVGKENIYFLVFSQNRPILDILDVAEAKNIIEIKINNPFSFSLSTLKALYKIRKEKIDTCVDMEFFMRFSAILSYCSGATIRIGLHQFNFEGGYRGDLFTHKLLYNPYVNIEVLFLSLVEAIKQNTNLNKPLIFQIPSIETLDLPSFSPSEEEKVKLKQKIESRLKAPLTKPIFIFHPNFSDPVPQRRWHFKNFIELGLLLKKEFPKSTIIITGIDKEKKECLDMAKQIIDVVSLAGETTLKELLLLYNLADFLITSDSGPAHFSSLTPIKTIVLFGPETPFLYKPISKNTIVIYKQLICSPCIKVYCPPHLS
ncbi:MAG: hypothetical protein NC918_06395, partial [Candidatus Omnitrophica bacterium]|nr:hypothetical protein [Candidatus Omnitrophota bacterium]